MPGVVLPALQQVTNYQPYIQQQQQIVLKKSGLPYIPPEVIRIILCLLKDDKKTLTACALVNHTFNLHVTPILYHTVSLSTPFTFNFFANTINEESQRSRLIRHLDLSVFSTFGLQKSDADIKKVVTSDILIKILRFCTMLETFSISDSLESSITLEVLKVLFECKNLKNLDFCAFSKKDFDSAMNSLADDMGIVKSLQYYDDDNEPKYWFSKIDNVSLPHLKRLSLHECHAISEHSTLITLLANSPNLTHLDLGGCSISDLTLNFIATRTNAPQKLTHLSLAKCKSISSEAIANLVAECEQLEVLNLYGVKAIEYDLDTILTSPSAKKFKSLDIGSSHITPHTLYTIQENCTSLTHLGIAKAFIRTPENLIGFLKAMPNLQYIDLTGIGCLTSLNTTYIISSLQKDHSLRVIEMSGHLLNKLATINGWTPTENRTRRSYYAKKTNGERPDRVHPRKLDVAETGSERMSNIFQYYSFVV